jgi:hypothetical protein
MRYYLVFSIILFTCSLKETIAAPTPIGITVICVDNPKCQYLGENIHLQVTVKNEQTFPIKLPMKYISSTGPSIRLTYNNGKRYVSLGTGIPDYQLRKDLITLNPGDAFSFLWRISRGEIDQLQTKPVDISAIVTLADTEQESDNFGLTKYIGKTIIHITEPP